MTPIESRVFRKRTNVTLQSLEKNKVFQKAVMTAVLLVVSTYLNVIPFGCHPSFGFYTIVNVASAACLLIQLVIQLTMLVCVSGGGTVSSSLLRFFFSSATTGVCLATVIALLSAFLLIVKSVHEVMIIEEISKKEKSSRMQSPCETQSPEKVLKAIAFVIIAYALIRLAGAVLELVDEFQAVRRDLKE